MSFLTTYIAARKANPFGQFGQANDTSTFAGATACGHTSVQSLLRAFRRILPTQDQISRAMGYWRFEVNGVPFGTSAEQVARALQHWGMPYVASYGNTIAQVLSWTRQFGPVIISVDYPDYPNWYNYHGVRRPVPYSQPHGHSGRNQFTGQFTHWIVVVGVVPAGSIYAGLIAVMEPNHHSGARPEEVVIDYVTEYDLNRTFRNAFTRTIVVRPTRSVA